MIESLLHRLAPVVQVTGSFPPPYYWQNDPLLQGIKRDARKHDISLEDLEQRINQSAVDETIHTIPSSRQALVGAQVARGGFNSSTKYVDPSIPGSGKTFAALCAVDQINRFMFQLTGEQRKVKITYFSPLDLIPKVQRSAHTIFGEDFGIVPITQESREQDLQKAASPDTSLVIVAHNASYLSLRADLEDQDVLVQEMAAYFKAMQELPSLKSSLTCLETLVGEKKTRRITQRLEQKYGIINRGDIVTHVVEARRKQRQQTVIEALQSTVLPPDGLYYTIIDEVHNIVDPQSITAKGLGSIFRNGRWGLALTGSIMGNYIKNDAWLASILGIVDDPRDYSKVVKGNPMRVKAAFRPHMVYPVITNVSQVDPDVPQPTRGFVEYEPLEEIVSLHVALENARFFSSGERTMISRYILTNPAKIHPDNLEITNENSLWDRAYDWIVEEDLISVIESAMQKPTNRIKALAQYLAQDPSQKTLVFSYYTHMTTNYLVQSLDKAGFKFTHIDQRVSSKIDTQGGSERMLRWERAQYDPAIAGCVASIGTTREGYDGFGYKRIVFFESPTVHFHKDQAEKRSAGRRGQRDVIDVQEMRVLGIPTDLILYHFREWKARNPRAFYSESDITPAELDEFMQDLARESQGDLAQLANLDSRAHLALFFNAHIGVGSQQFHDSLNIKSNHRFLVERFNVNYASSHSANVGRLVNQLIHGDLENTPGIEKRDGVKIKQVLDLGTGPCGYSQASGKPSIAVDISGLMLDIGERATSSIEDMQRYMGSIHDLSKLVELHSTKDSVYNPSKAYDEYQQIEDNSVDFALLSNCVYYLDATEKIKLVKELKRVVKDNMYIQFVMPKSKVSVECEPQFCKDLEDCGFIVDKELTGVYGAQQGYDTLEDVTKSNPSFRSVIIVAQHDASIEAHFEPDRNYFVLQDAYEVREGTIKLDDITRAKKESKGSRFVLDGFYKAGNLHYDLPKQDETPTPDTSSSSPTSPTSPNSFDALLQQIEKNGLGDDLLSAVEAFDGVFK